MKKEPKPREWAVDTLGMDLSGEWQVLAPGETPMLFKQAVEKLQAHKKLHHEYAHFRIRNTKSNMIIPEELL